MKHTFLLLSLLLLLCCTTACRQERSRFVIGVSQCSDDEWRHKMNQEILREVLFYNDVKVEIRTAKDNTEQQKADIRYFMEKGVDLIMVAPNEEAPLTEIVEEAFDRGITVIVFDRKVLTDKYTAFIGADNYEIGKSVGNYVATLLEGRGNVIEITGLKGSTPAFERHQGFANAITAYSNLHLIAQADASWLYERGEEQMDSLLRLYPQVDVIYAQNDRMGAGAYRAALNQGREKEIRFVGIDALPGEGYGLDLVEKGMLDATFIYPTAGDKMVQLAINILEEKPYPRETLLATAVVDATNARVMALQTSRIAELDNKIEALNNRIALYLSRYASQQLFLYGSLLILFLVASLLVILFHSLRSKNRLNRKLSGQKKQLEIQRDQLIDLSKQLEEATHAKLVFFTNISHDFRTPLTLIADPLEQLLTEEQISSQGRKHLRLAKKNVSILLRLVNQILDFRKYENGKLELSFSQVDLLQCITGWSESFQEAIRRKYIHFSLKSEPEVSYELVADLEKLERIYFNLMSNAVKFTPENGCIAVRLSSVRREGDEVHGLRFTITNTGSLIEAEHIQNIFDRFYKIEQHHAGSGIGLALVKAFVELHQGSVAVASDRDRGTVFTVDLPVLDIKTEKVIERVPVSSPTLPDLAVWNDSEAAFSFDPDKFLILVIDDNADIREYIRELLQGEYSVLEAADGLEGIRKAMKYVPDVIVSDVMMPGIDGVECCRRLKSELQTCHIPVILLTACSLDEQRILGYDGGADSYISKPFNSQVLHSRVRNLIESAQRIKQAAGENQFVSRENICDMDQKFINKFNALLEERMNDSSLNVEDLGREMNLSRVQLYRKIKSLTNFSPNELLRIARLKKAATLLASADFTVAEIGYEVGFTSPSYFAKCYKEQYGESPTESVKRRKR